MADEFVISILERWQMEDLVETFKANSVDFDAFQLLNETLIKELVPKVGQRLKFLREWNSEFGRSNSPLNVPLTPVPVSCTTSCSSSMDSDSGSDTSKDTILLDLTESEGGETADVPVACSSPLPATLKRQNAFSFNVIDLLSQDKEGQQVIKNIQQKKFCTPSDRRILINRCVAAMTQKHGMRPDAAVKEAMAASIVSDFPCLKDPEGSGYAAFYTKGQHKRPAFGWLEDHLRYIRKKGKKLATEHVSVSTSQTTKGVPMEDNCPEVITDEEAGTLTEWLKHNLQPMSVVTDYMKKTARHRSKFIKSDNKSVSAILTCYPRLLSPGMIEQDFDLMYGASSNNLYMKWDSLAGKVISYTQQTIPSWPDLLHWEKPVESLTSDEKKNLAFFLLPLIFRGRAKNRGSCTTQSSIEAFIDQQPTVTSVVSYCQNIQKEDKPQPFILSLGCNKASPQQTFVIIERNPVMQSSLLKAVDYCFKSHYVFDVNFQAQCKGVWEFFHSEVYDLGRIQSRSLSMFRAFHTAEGM